MKYLLFASLIAIAALSLTDASSKDGRKKKITLRKPGIVDQVFVNYNNWSYAMRNNGSFMYDPSDLDNNTKFYGGEFPRGSATSLVYAAGFYIGTLKNGIPVVSETEFTTEFQPGRIINSGMPFGQLKAEDPLSAQQQVYLIDRTRSGDDYVHWPEDALHDKYGDPAMIADAQTWAVFNDLDTSLNHESPSESPSPGLGIEVTLESFAFNGPKIGDVVYLRFILENKTNGDYPQTYFGIWSDADVGNSSNDLVGTDTIRNMEFVYNNTNESPDDRAVGFDLVQGPIAGTSEIPDRDLLRNQNRNSCIRYDRDEDRFIPQTLADNKIVLGCTTSDDYAEAEDPVKNSERYTIMRGISKWNSALRTGCGLNDYFVFRGNPLTDQGTCDVAGSNNPLGGMHSIGRDIRILMGSGPFTIKAGESQEIWVAVVGATGVDRLDAVANLFAADDLAQYFFDHGFPAPAPPETPKLTASSFEDRFVLTWQNNAESSEDPAGELLGVSIANGYTADYVKNDFQGYRVYKSLTGLLGTFSMLAQYDKPDTFGSVINYTLNANNHVVASEVDLGSNTGLQYHYVDQDVVYATRYYYAVTAYDAQPYIGGPDSVNLFEGFKIPKPSGLPVTLESSPMENMVAMYLTKPVLSIVYNASLDSTRALHVMGGGDGYVELEMVDPSRVRTLNYTIEFFEIPPDSFGGNLIGSEFLPSDLLAYRFVADDTVRMIDSRKDDPRTFYDKNADGLYQSGTDIALDESRFATARAFAEDPSSAEPLVIHGIMVTVFRPRPDFKAFNVTANAGGPLDPVAAGAATPALNNMGFPSDDSDLVRAQQVNGSYWLLNASTGVIFSDGSYNAYKQNAVTGWNANGWYDLIPYDLEIRFTAAGQTGQLHNTTTQRNMPFEVWNATLGTQLLVTTIDDNTSGAFDLRNTDHPVSGGNNDPFTDRFYIYNPSDMSAGSAGYEAWKVSNDPIVPTYQRTLGRQIFVNLNGGDVGTGIYNAPLPEIGTVFRINTVKNISSGDVFVFSTTAHALPSNKKDLKKALRNIKVVPNPYYRNYFHPHDDPLRFTGLPAQCTIRIFTVAGDLIRTLHHDEGSDNERPDYQPHDDAYDPEPLATSIERWDRKTANGRFAAAGMYIALIESKEGKRFVKFAIIQ